MQHELGPCGPTLSWVHAFIAVVQCVQSVAIAYLTVRARRKNREERNGD